APGYFKTVKSGKEPGSTPDRIVLVVTVEEQSTGNFSISGGYSSVDGAIGEVSISERNFMGRGQFVKLSVGLGQYSNGVDLAFTHPQFCDNRMSLGLELFDKQTTSSTYQAYDTTTYGGKISLAAPLTDTVGAELRYSLYNQSVTLDPTNGVASLPIQQAALAGPIWVSSIGVG